MPEYDPVNDPRYLGQDPDKVRASQDDLDAEAAVIQGAIAGLTNLMEMFEHPGWDVLYRDLEAKRNDALTQMQDGTCKQLSDYDERKGRIAAFNAVLNAPSNVAMAREVEIERLRHLSTAHS